MVGPPVESDWAWTPAVLVLGVLESEPVCALAGKASIPARKTTNTGLRKCLGEAGTHISRPWLRRDQHCRHIYNANQQQNLRWIKNANSMRTRGMDVGVTSGYALPTRLSVLRFSRNPTGPQLGLGETKQKPRPQPRMRLGPFCLDSSSQFLHVFILVSKSRFDLTIRMTSTRAPSCVSPAKSFIDSCD